MIKRQTNINRNHSKTLLNTPAQSFSSSINNKRFKKDSNISTTHNSNTINTISPSYSKTKFTITNTDSYHKRPLPSYYNQQNYNEVSQFTIPQSLSQQIAKYHLSHSKNTCTIPNILQTNKNRTEMMTQISHSITQSNNQTLNLIMYLMERIKTLETSQQYLKEQLRKQRQSNKDCLYKIHQNKLEHRVKQEQYNRLQWKYQIMKNNTIKNQAAKIDAQNIKICVMNSEGFNKNRMNNSIYSMFRGDQKLDEQKLEVLQGELDYPQYILEKDYYNQSTFNQQETLNQQNTVLQSSNFREVSNKKSGFITKLGNNRLLANRTVIM